MIHCFSRSPELERGCDEPRLLVPLSLEFPPGVAACSGVPPHWNTSLTGAVGRPESAKRWTDLIKGGGVVLEEHLQDIIKP